MHLVNGVGAWGGFGCNLQLGPSQRRSDRPLPFVCRRAVRRDRFHITLNGQVTVSIVPSTGRMYIQERGFRTRRVGSVGVGGIGSSKSDYNKTKWSIFSDMLGVTKKSKEETPDGWNQYDSELKKLPEAQQKTYTVSSKRKYHFNTEIYSCVGHFFTSVLYAGIGIADFVLRDDISLAR
ncbi:hypothetical protein COOONC_04998 [Cooperia oncophora]